MLTDWTNHLVSHAPYPTEINNLLMDTFTSGGFTLVHKQMSNSDFKGLQVTFEALTNLCTPTHN